MEKYKEAQKAQRVYEYGLRVFLSLRGRQRKGAGGHGQGMIEKKRIHPGGTVLGNIAYRVEGFDRYGNRITQTIIPEAAIKLMAPNWHCEMRGKRCGNHTL